MNRLQWFFKDFFFYAELMKNKTSPESQSNLWDHSAAIYNEALNQEHDLIIQYSALLHGLGLIYLKEQTTGYEGISCFTALDVLNKTSLSQAQKVRILKLISHRLRFQELLSKSNALEEIKKTFAYEERLIKDLVALTRCEYSVQNKAYSNELFMELEQLNQKIKINKRKAFKLDILVGIPGSGKSSWVEKHATHDALIISRDQSILDIGHLHGATNYDEAYDLLKSDKAIKKEVDRQDERVEAFAKSSNHVIIDNPNLKPKNRLEFINLLQQTHHIKVELFLIPYQKLLQQNLLRAKRQGKTIQERTILNKLKTFSFPLLSEGFHKLQVIEQNEPMA